MADYEFVVVGAGPGGLQMGYFLQKHGLSYTILEAADKPASFFQTYPRHRKLISINKRFNLFPEEDFNLRHDWNSLLSDDPELLFTKYSKELFPHADDLCRYLSDYAQKLKLKIQYNWRVSKISRSQHDNKKHKSLFTIRGPGGATISCHVLFIATGATSERLPDIEGIELAETYGTHSTVQEEYENKTVGIIGGANSAFETADHLAGHAGMIGILANDKVNMAWDTHFVGNLRAVNNTIIDMVQLKSMHSVIRTEVKKLEKIQDKIFTTFELDAAHSINPGPSTLTLVYPLDKIIVATGWNYVNLDMFDESCLPATKNNGKFPILDACWESTVPDMFFIGTSMQARDRRAASGFLHGFRYAIMSLFHLLHERLHQVLSPREIFIKPKMDDVITFILSRISTVSSLFQLNQGVLCDVILWDLNTETNGKPIDLEAEIPGTVTYIKDLPSAYVMENDWFQQHPNVWMITIEELHDNFPDDIQSTELSTIGEEGFQSHMEVCDPFVRHAFRYYNKGESKETLFFNGTPMVRADLPMFIIGDRVGERSKNLLKNLLCRSTGLALDNYDESTFGDEMYNKICRVWTEEEKKELQKKEKQKQLARPALCPRYHTIHQPHLPANRETLLKEIIKDTPAVKNNKN